METTTAFQVIPALLKEMEQEAKTTRKFLARVPEEHFGWQPHPKSMTLKMLATHIAELPGWVTMGLTTAGLDFAQNPYKVKDVRATGELLDYFEETLASGLAALASAEDLTGDWILRNGDIILQHYNKYEVIRMTMSQIIHHRAQLGVYFRLLGIPVPASYGPSADSNEFEKN